MAEQTSNPESASTIPKAQFGNMGRLLDPEWSSLFCSSFLELAALRMPSGIDFIPRLNPGIVYLEKNEIAKASIKPGFLEGILNTEQAVERLRLRGITNEFIASSSLRVWLKEFSPKRIRTASGSQFWQLRAAMLESPNLLSTHSAVIGEEKHHIQRIASFRSLSPTAVNPKHYVSLGTLRHGLNPTFLSAMEKRTASPGGISLGPLCNMNQSLESSSSPSADEPKAKFGLENQ